MANYDTRMQVNMGLNSQGLIKGVDQVNKQMMRMNSTLDKVKGSLIKTSQVMASLYIATQTLKAGLKALTFPVSEGFEYNKVIDEQVTSIRALIVATSEDVTSKGRQIGLIEKYSMANREALGVMEDLKKINEATPHTLAETAKIYKTIFAQAKQTGASTEQMVQATQSLSIASKAGGLDLDVMLKSVDSLATGTYLANSEFGKFSEAIGVSRVKMKELAEQGEGKSMEYLVKQLEQFNIKTNAWSVNVSQAQNAWDTLTGAISRPTFEGAKEGLKGITTELTKITDNKDLMEGLTETYSNMVLKIVNGIRYLAKAVLGYFKLQIKLASYVEKVIERLNSLFTLSSSGKAFFDNLGKWATSTSDKVVELATNIWKAVKGTGKLFTTANDVLDKRKYGARSAGRAKYEDSIKPKLDKADKQINDSTAKQMKALNSLETALDNTYEAFAKGVKKTTEESKKLVREGTDGKEGLIPRVQDPFDNEAVQRGILTYSKEIEKAQTSLDQNYMSSLNKNTEAFKSEQTKRLDAQYEYYQQTLGNSKKLEDWYETSLSKIEKQHDKTFKSGAVRAIEEYTSKAKDMAGQIEGAMTNALGGLEDVLVDFVTTGKASFKDLANSIVADLIRIAIRSQIVAPLANAMGITTQAQGGAWNNGVQMFATGGVVNAPTLFGHSGGLGVMGEAGAEAIMPLQRVGGDMGVRSVPSKVSLNIVNETSTPVEAEMINEMLTKNSRGEEERVVSIVMKNARTNPAFKQALGGR